MQALMLRRGAGELWEITDQRMQSFALLILLNGAAVGHPPAVLLLAPLLAHIADAVIGGVVFKSHAASSNWIGSEEAFSLDRGNDNGMTERLRAREPVSA
tara:strand:- start:10818 stop:11117 length:300 start_codon:yes stop_codon:yes gene_type:complete